MGRTALCHCRPPDSVQSDMSSVVFVEKFRAEHGKRGTRFDQRREVNM